MGVRSPTGAEIFLVACVLGPIQPRVRWVQRALSRGMTTHPLLVPRLKMNVYTDGFTFLLVSVIRRSSVIGLPLVYPKEFLQGLPLAFPQLCACEKSEIRVCLKICSNEPIELRLVNETSQDFGKMYNTIEYTHILVRRWLWWPRDADCCMRGNFCALKAPVDSAGLLVLGSSVGNSLEGDCCGLLK